MRGAGGKRSRPSPKGRAREAAAGDREVDGRLQRSVRSRQRIVEALTELIAEGDLQPTGERVAARAGYGLRTVYRHFEDMEGLYREVQGYLEGLFQPLAGEPMVEGGLDDRIRVVVQRRASVYERAAPFLRSGASLRWRSLFLRRAHAAMVRDLRQDLVRSLPEVERGPDSRRDAVELLTSFEAWDRLRTDQSLGRDRAQRVVEAATRGLLGSSGTRRRRPGSTPSR